MAYSKVIITFNAVPNLDEVLNIAETSLSLNLNEIFKEARYVSGQCGLPPFIPEDGIHPDRYIGFVSANYKTAFNADHNTTALFTVTSTNGTTNSGIGTVTITANYSGAVFVLGTSTADLDIDITNETPVTPPPGTISFTPNSIAFEHAQNDTLPSFGIAFSGDLWKIVGKPNFLLSSSTSGVTITTTGSGAGLYQTISGSGDALVNIALTAYYDTDITFSGADIAGTFQVLKDNVAEGTIAYTVAITKLSDFLTIPYVSGNKAFTLDTKFFDFFSSNADTYFQFDAAVKTYDFFTNALNEYSITQKIGLFQGKAKANLGQIIHRLMQNFNTVNETLLQYKEATIKITCSEKLLANDAVIRTGQSTDIPFIAGLSRGITTLGFLDFNLKPNRVTKNSFTYLNILIPDTGIYLIYSYKNGLPLPSITLTASSSHIICYKILFSDYEKGDVIDFYLFNATTGNRIDSTRKTFKLFPEGNHSNHIVWENEFLLQSAIECTGTASIKSDFEFQSQKVFNLLVEKLEYLNTTKEVRFTINTGWLLKSDIDTIESLMRAKRVWLINGDSTIEIRPTSKSILNDDIERELIEFTLEFIINRTYNEETYSL